MQLLRLVRTGMVSAAMGAVVAASGWLVAVPAAAQTPLPPAAAVARPLQCPDVKGAVACQIRFSQFRPLDSRVARLEAGGVAALTAGSRVVRVGSPAELQRLQGRLQPGDLVLLAGREWRDASITIDAAGTFERPIVVSAESPEGLRLTGRSQLRARGSNIVLAGLRFVDGDMPEQGGAVMAVGSSTRPCNQCIVWSSQVHGYNTDKRFHAKASIHYLVLAGRDITVANSSFRRKLNRGKMLTNQPTDGVAPRLHVLRNRFADRPPAPDGGNGYEVIQLGSSADGELSAYSVLEGNVFEDCDGEPELVAIKYSDVMVLRNQFVRSQGMLSLRHADRVYVAGNRFVGGGKDSTGGVRVIGAGHVLVDNEFTGMRRPRTAYYAPISVQAGDAAATRSGAIGYGQVRDLIIAGNRFVDNDTGIELGTGLGPKLHLPPRGLAIVGNVATQPGRFVRYAARREPEPGDQIGIRDNTVCSDDEAGSPLALGGANRLFRRDSCPAETRR